MSQAETDAHRQLKQLATTWARAAGFHAVATEVTLPRSAFRADVVAYRRKLPGIGTTAVFECKQARADFLKDSYRQQETAAALQKLDARRAKLEDLLKLHYPSLRKGETLFAEFDAVDLRGLEHQTYRRVLREMERLQRGLFGKTKFDKLSRYRCANLNYLVVEPGILDLPEVPVGWGLLVRHGEQLTLDRSPVWQEVAEIDRLRLLERIAARTH